LEVKESLWEKRVRKNASTKGLGSCDRIERGVYTKERESIFVVKRGKGGSASICRRSTAKRVCQHLKSNDWN